MLALQASDLYLVDGNARNTRPPASTGTSVAPGASNVKGSYTQLIASTADEAHGIQIAFGSDTGASRAKLMDIAIGGAGSETVLIPDLLVGPISTLNPTSGAAGGGMRYFFPIRIPAGTRISCRGQVNNATAGTVSVYVWLYKARLPSFKCGSRVVAYGVDSANSRGVAITEGTTSDGTWASLGTIASGDRPFYWELGVTYDAAAINARSHFADLSVGGAGGDRIIIEDKVIAATTTPVIGFPAGVQGNYCKGVPGEQVWGRQQNSAGAETGFYHAAYGVI